MFDFGLKSLHMINASRGFPLATHSSPSRGCSPVGISSLGIHLNSLSEFFKSFLFFIYWRKILDIVVIISIHLFANDIFIML